MWSRLEYLGLVPVVILAVALTGSAATANASTTASTAAHTANWRVVTTGSMPCRQWHTHQYNAEIQDVTALSTRDAWAAGQCVAGGSVIGIAGHWNGQRWTFSRLPAQADLDFTPYGDDLVAATSDRDVWVAAGADDETGRDANAALHWNGHRWTDQSKGLPDGDGFITIDATAATGTWAIVRLEDQDPTQNVRGVALVHWTGRAWQQIAIPSAFGTDFPPDELAVGPGGNVWVGGAVGNGGYGHPLIADYRAGKWRQEIQLPQRTQSGGRVDGFAVAGSSVWAIADYLAVPMSSDVLTLIAGGPRTYVTAPGASNGTVQAAAGNSRGDLYLVRPLVTGLQYWNGHTWTTDTPPVPAGSYVYQGTNCYPVGPMPNPPTEGVNVLALSATPGSAMVWAAGFVAGGSQPLYPACAEPTAQPLTEVSQ
jgi:hypothetical protein